MKREFASLGLLCLVLTLMSAQANAQSARSWGRVSFMAQGLSAADQGRSLDGFHELSTSVSFGSPLVEKGGTEYRFDIRTATYPGVLDRSPRVSIYDAYVGQRLRDGTVNIRAGQMWLNDLGGLGSLGGFLVEFVRPKVAGFRRIRIGGFAGLEPKILQAGYVSRVKKLGGYLTLEGEGARRHVVGLVTLRDAGLTERSVVTTANFLPMGKRFFMYQVAEYDLVGPAGNGSGGLTYFFTNVRVSPASRVELEGTYHRGRSIDTRSITLDQLNGRPVSARALEGLLYQSTGARVTVTAMKNVRLFAGYARDRNNRDDAPTGRTTLGLVASNLFKTGIDVRVSDARVNRPTSSYNSWDASVGRNFGSKLYLSADYSSSLSIFQFTTLGGVQVTSRPRTKRYSFSGNANLNRWLSFMGTLERLRDGTLTEYRWLSGLTFRY